MRLLLIEDDVETARYIRNGLAESGHEVVWSQNGYEGMQLALTGQWDLLILDRMLPDDIDGLKILKNLRSAGKQWPVLILSALASIDERVIGLRAGGDDYLTKPFAFPELNARCDALLRRVHNPGKDEVSELWVADLKLDLRSRKAERNGAPILLQPREFRLLEFLVRHQGQVVTRTMLLESVWDYHFDPQTNVVDVQISRLRNKIDKTFSPALLHTERGIGYSIGILD